MPIQVLKAPVAEAAEIPIKKEAEPLRTREDFERYIDEQAPKYGVSPAKAKARISCETGGTWNPTIQSGYFRNGKQEQSFGLAQINLPSHPNISYNQATDAKFSIDYIIQNWHKDHWSCP